MPRSAFQKLIEMFIEAGLKEEEVCFLLMHPQTIAAITRQIHSSLHTAGEAFAQSISAKQYSSAKSDVGRRVKKIHWEAGVDALKKKGQKISIRNLAKELTISRATIYNRLKADDCLRQHFAHLGLY